jgi:hypothetical protein
MTVKRIKLYKPKSLTLYLKDLKKKIYRIKKKMMVWSMKIKIFKVIEKRKKI